MKINNERRNTIALLLSRYTEDAEAERGQAKAELECMTNEELRLALENFKHEAEKEWQADRMDILEGRGE